MTVGKFANIHILIL